MALLISKLFLKGQCHKIFEFCFFHESVPPSPWVYHLDRFEFFRIISKGCTGGVGTHAIWQIPPLFLNLTAVQRSSALLKNKTSLHWYELKSTHRVAATAFWRTFHHDGKSSPGWCGWGGGGGARPPPFSLLPSRTKLQCTLQLSGQIRSPYFNFTNICTLWVWVRSQFMRISVTETKMHCYIVKFFINSVCAKLWWPLAHTKVPVPVEPKRLFFRLSR